MTVSTSFIADNRIVKCCRKEEDRLYVLESVYCSSGTDTVWLSATNGKQLVAKKVEGNSDKAKLVPVAAFPKTGKAPATIELNGNLGWKRENTKVETLDMPDGRYPKASDVFKDASDCIYLGIDHELLSRLGQAISAPKIGREDGNSKITLLIKVPKKRDEDSGEEQYVTNCAVEDGVGVLGPEGIGVIMPCSVDVEGIKRYDEQVCEFKMAFEVPEIEGEEIDG